MFISKNIFSDKLAKIKAEGLYKKERTLTTPQGIIISTLEGGEVLNFCANNYLGLSDNTEIKRTLRNNAGVYTNGNTVLTRAALRL